MAFFQQLKEIYDVSLGFFPTWFRGAIDALLIGLGVFVLINVAQRLKDLFWPL